jgi:hypothetical protein
MSNDRASQITSILSGIASKVMAAGDNVTATKAANKAALAVADKNEITTRDALFAEIASASHNGEWTEIEISQAASAVVSGFNGDDKVKKTFQNIVSELKAAMHPNVREYVGELVKLRDAAYADEAERKAQDKAYSEPVATAYPRKINLLTALINEGKNHCRIYTRVSEVVDFARHMDPAYDADKMVKVFNKAQQALRDFYADCQVPQVASAISEIANVTDSLVAQHIKARPEKPTLSFQHPALNKVTDAPKAPVTPTLTLPKAPAPNVRNPAPPAKKVQVSSNTLSALDTLMEKKVA